MTSRIKLLLLCTAIFVTNFIACMATWFLASSTFNSVTDKAASPGIAIVFYSAKDHATKQRVIGAYELHQDRIVSRLLFVGGNRRSANPNGSRYMYDMARKLGLPPDCLSFDTTSFDTVTNLLVACERRRDAGVETPIVFVSDPLHLRRIAMLTENNHCFNGALFHPVQPDLSLLSIWSRVNKDWLSRIAYTILSQQNYLFLVRWLRG